MMIIFEKFNYGERDDRLLKIERKNGFSFSLFISVQSEKDETYFYITS